MLILDIHKAGGYATLLNLLGRDMEEVRILSLKMIGCLLKDGSNKGKAKFTNFCGYVYSCRIYLAYY